MSDLPPKAPPAAPLAAPPAAPADPAAFDPGPPPDEFAHIPARRPRPPVVAIGAALLALFLAARLRHDVAYAFSPRAPIEIADARSMADHPAADLPLNRLVRLQGRPERESAVVLDARGSWTFTQFFRLRGSKGRVFVRRVADPLPVPLADRDVFTGRLVAFGELSFAESIAKHFAARVTATHFFASANLGAALAAGAAAPVHVRDRAGDKVTLAPTDRLAIDVALSDQFAIELPVEAPQGRLSGTSAAIADLTAVRSAIIAAGGALVGEVTTPKHVTLTVSLPAAVRDAAMSRLESVARGVPMRAARSTVEIAVSEIVVADQIWQLGRNHGARKVPASDIIAIRTRATVEIPKDAVLLIEGETPAREVKAVVVLAFLAAFAAVNLLSLRRAG